jgi:dynein heavy chain 1, cytosolic
MWNVSASLCHLQIQPHKDIVTAQMRLQWAQHGLPSDALCLENACILERALRPPLVIDPSDIAGSYIKSSLNSKAAGSSITSTFNDAAFPRQLENCLRFGTALIVSDVVSVDPILLPLLNREFRKTGGRCLVRLGSSEVDCSPSIFSHHDIALFQPHHRPGYQQQNHSCEFHCNPVRA